MPVNQKPLWTLDPYGRAIPLIPVQLAPSHAADATVAGIAPPQSRIYQPTAGPLEHLLNIPRTHQSVNNFCSEGRTAQGRRFPLTSFNSSEELRLVARQEKTLLAKTGGAEFAQLLLEYMKGRPYQHANIRKDLVADIPKYSIPLVNPGETKIMSRGLAVLEPGIIDALKEVALSNGNSTGVAHGLMHGFPKSSGGKTSDGVASVTTFRPVATEYAEGRAERSGGTAVLIDIVVHGDEAETGMRAARGVTLRNNAVPAEKDPYGEHEVVLDSTNRYAMERLDTDLPGGIVYVKLHAYGRDEPLSAPRQPFDSAHDSAYSDRPSPYGSSQRTGHAQPTPSREHARPRHDSRHTPYPADAGSAYRRPAEAVPAYRDPEPKQAYRVHNRRGEVESRAHEPAHVSSKSRHHGRHHDDNRHDRSHQAPAPRPSVSRQDSVDSLADLYEQHRLRRR